MNKQELCEVFDNGSVVYDLDADIDKVSGSEKYEVLLEKYKDVIFKDEEHQGIYGISITDDGFVVKMVSDNHFDWIIFKVLFK